MRTLRNFFIIVSAILCVETITNTGYSEGFKPPTGTIIGEFDSITLFDASKVVLGSLVYHSGIYGESFFEEIEGPDVTTTTTVKPKGEVGPPVLPGQSTFLVYSVKGRRSELVASVTTLPDGEFFLYLVPGNYEIVPVDEFPFFADSFPITVRKNQYSFGVITYDFELP